MIIKRKTIYSPIHRIILLLEGISRLLVNFFYKQFHNNMELWVIIVIIAIVYTIYSTIKAKNTEAGRQPLPAQTGRKVLEPFKKDLTYAELKKYNGE